MSKFAKFTLLTLAAFLLLGFSITANAAKSAKLQVIRSAPMLSKLVTCQAVNQTQHAISAHSTIVGQIPDDPWTVLRLSEEDWEFLAGGPMRIQGDEWDSYLITFCALSWYGEPDDFQATMCTYEPGHEGIPPSACLELH